MVGVTVGQETAVTDGSRTNHPIRAQLEKAELEGGMLIRKNREAATSPVEISCKVNGLGRQYKHTK